MESYSSPLVRSPPECCQERLQRLRWQRCLLWHSCSVPQQIRRQPPARPNSPLLGQHRRHSQPACLLMLQLCNWKQCKYCCCFFHCLCPRLRRQHQACQQLQQGEVKVGQGTYAVACSWCWQVEWGSSSATLLCGWLLRFWSLCSHTGFWVLYMPWRHQAQSSKSWLRLSRLRHPCFSTTPWLCCNSARQHLLRHQPSTKNNPRHPSLLHRVTTNP